MSSIKKIQDKFKKIRVYLKKNRIPPGSRILIGYSGGPDSTALLNVLLHIEYPLKLICAYLDHGIRPRDEVNREIDFIQKSCKLLNLELLIDRIEYGLLMRKAGEAKRSIEDLAREKRYLFLRNCMQKVNADYIALGHTLDDHIETLVMRFFQGTGVTGLTGIPDRRGNIIRPLIHCTRNEILDFLKVNNISYCIDSTNLEEEYLRNKVRIHLLPVIEKLFPGYRSSLSVLTQKMSSIKSYLEVEAENRLCWKKSRWGYHIKGANFIEAPGPVRIFSIFPLINRLNKDLQRVPYRFVSPLLQDSFIRRRVILSGYGIRLRWSGDDLFIERDIVCEPKKGYLIIVNENQSYSIQTAGLIFRFLREDEPADKTRIMLDKDSTSGRVVIRSIRQGDVIETEGGTKKVKKLLSEWKVPLTDRWKVPIIEDRRGIIAVIGQPMGYKNRFRPRRGKGLELSISIIYMEEL